MSRRPKAAKEVKEVSPATDPKANDKLKANLGDSAALKRILDDTVAEALSESGYKDDHFVSNFKMGLGTLTCAFALTAQFYPMKFPDNWWLLFFCVTAYVLCTAALNLFISYVEGDVILFTLPHKGQALRVTSKLPRYSPMYTLKLALKDSDPLREETFTKSITSYFYETGRFAPDKFRPDVELLLKQLEQGAKKTK